MIPFESKRARSEVDVPAQIDVATIPDLQARGFLYRSWNAVARIFSGSQDQDSGSGPGQHVPAGVHGDYATGFCSSSFMTELREQRNFVETVVQQSRMIRSSRCQET